MPKLYRLLITISVFAMLFGSGCAGQRGVERLYRSDSVAAPFGNFLIVAIYSDASARRDYERAVVRALGGAGIAAQTSLEFMLSTDTIDRDALAAIAEEQSIDAVLISRPIAIETEGEFVQGRSAVTAERRSDLPIADFFRYHYDEYEDPMTFERTASVVIETDVYRVADESRIWQVRSSAIDKTSVYDVVTSVAQTLTRALREDGLIQ